MKLYVAGKWQDRPRIRRIQNALVRMGHEITVDWTQHDFGPDAPQSLLKGIAAEDAYGVAMADYVIAILIKPFNYKGLWCEVGMAIALGKKVLAVGSAGDSCIFVNHPLVTSFDSVAGCLKFIRTEGSRRSETWWLP